MFRYAGVPPKQKITTFKISDNALIKPGLTLTAGRQLAALITAVVTFSSCVIDVFRHPSLRRTLPARTVRGRHGQNVSSTSSVFQFNIDFLFFGHWTEKRKKCSPWCYGDLHWNVPPPSPYIC